MNIKQAYNQLKTDITSEERLKLHAFIGIYEFDRMLKQGIVTFKEACQGWQAVREGAYWGDVFHGILDRRELKEKRMNRKQEKKMKKNHAKYRQETLEQLIDGLEDRAYAAIWDNNNPGAWEIWFEATWPMRPSEDDALNYVSAEASRKLNAPRIGKDALDLCYSNTYGAEVLF